MGNGYWLACIKGIAHWAECRARQIHAGTGMTPLQNDCGGGAMPCCFFFLWGEITASQLDMLYVYTNVHT